MMCSVCGQKGFSSLRHVTLCNMVPIRKGGLKKKKNKNIKRLRVSHHDERLFGKVCMCKKIVVRL